MRRARRFTQPCFGSPPLGGSLSRLPASRGRRTFGPHASRLARQLRPSPGPLLLSPPLHPYGWANWARVHVVSCACVRGRTLSPPPFPKAHARTSRDCLFSRSETNCLGQGGASRSARARDWRQTRLLASWLFDWTYCGFGQLVQSLRDSCRLLESRMWLLCACALRCAPALLS